MKNRYEEDIPRKRNAFGPEEGEDCVVVSDFEYYYAIDDSENDY